MITDRLFHLPPIQWMRRHKDLTLLISTFIITLVMIWWYGGLTNLTEMASVDLMRTSDSLFVKWTLFQAYENLLHNPLALGQSDMFYGVPGSFGYTVAPYGVALQTFPIYLLTGQNPTLTANVYILLAFVATAWFAYRLARYLFDVTWLAGIFAAWALTFSPFRLTHIEHFEILSIHLLIALLWIMHRLLDQPSLRRGLLLGAIFALTLATNAYFGVFAVIMLGVMGLFVVIVRWSSLIRSHGASLALAALTGLLASLPFVLFRLGAINAVGNPDPNTVLDRSATLMTWLSPDGWLWQQIGVETMVQRSLWVGGIVLILFFLGLRTYFRDSPSRGFFSTTQLTALYLTIGLVAFILSFGPQVTIGQNLVLPMPFSLIDDLPGFSGVRAPRRIGMIAHICIVLLAAFTLSALQKRSKWLHHYGLSLVAILILGLDLLPPEDNEFMIARYQPLDTAIYERLAEDPPHTQVVMHLPLSKFDIAYALSFQPIHQQWMVSGFASAYPEEVIPLTRHYFDIETPVFSDQTLQLALDRGATRVVVNYELMNDEEMAEYWAYRKAPDSLWQQLIFVGTIGSADLYDVPPELLQP